MLIGRRDFHLQPSIFVTSDQRKSHYTQNMVKEVIYAIGNALHMQTVLAPKDVAEEFSGNLAIRFQTRTVRRLQYQR